MSALRARYAEVTIVDVQVGQPIAPAVEQVEDLKADLEVRRLSDARLLHNAEVLGKERRGAQTAVGGSGVSEEPERVWRRRLHMLD